MRMFSASRTLVWISLFLIWLLPALGAAQPTVAGTDAGTEDKVSWTVRLRDADVRAGETTQLLFTAKIAPGWHIFGRGLQGDWVEVTPTLAEDDPVFEAVGDMIEPAGTVKIVPGFEQEAVWYENEVTFALPVRVKAGVSGEVTGTLRVRAQACDDTTCDQPRRVELPVTFTVASGEARSDRTAPVTEMPAQPAGYTAPPDDKSSAKLNQAEPAAPTDATATSVAQAREQGPLAFFALAFVAGLLALLTPCVWPMIPVTVSVFSKQSGGDKKEAVRKSLLYGLGIVITFALIGVVVTLLFGATGVSDLAASPWVNLFLGVLFIALALNLFGFYEIQVPSGLIGALQSKSKTAGAAAPLFLGFVFSLTTFTCTVPFAGTVLVSAAQGDLLYPIIGMLGFGLAFAIPFFVLSLVPQKLAALPKSGNWLNATKVYMGFLELAAAMKFLSNAELSRGLGLLPYATYMGIWGAIFVVAALFLFGAVKLPNDDGSVVGNGRRLFGVVNVGIALFMFWAVERPTSIGSLSAFTPPAVYPGSGDKAVGGIPWIYSFDEAKAKAQETSTPLFLNFTGVTCGNCRVMENDKFPRPEYRAELDKFVLAELYTDRENPEDEANAKLREELTKSATNPVYVIMAPDGRVVSIYQGMAVTDADFIKWMKDGFAKASGSAIASR